MKPICTAMNCLYKTLLSENRNPFSFTDEQFCLEVHQWKRIKVLDIEARVYTLAIPSNNTFCTVSPLQFSAL